MIAEFKLRQTQYQTENGSYLSSGADETDTHPAAPAGPDTPVSIAPVPATWTALRMQPDKDALYCAYVTIAGDANDNANIGAKAGADFGFTAPNVDWFYVLAECDFDGDATNSFYFSSSYTDGIASQNAGR